MNEFSQDAQWHEGSSRAPLRTRQRQTGDQVTISKGIALHVLERVLRKFAPRFAGPGQRNLGDLPCKVSD